MNRRARSQPLGRARISTGSRSRPTYEAAWTASTSHSRSSGTVCDGARPSAFDATAITLLLEAHGARLAALPAPHDVVVRRPVVAVRAEVPSVPIRPLPRHARVYHRCRYTSVKDVRSAQPIERDATTTPPTIHGRASTLRGSSSSRRRSCERAPCRCWRRQAPSRFGRRATRRGSALENLANLVRQRGLTIRRRPGASRVLTVG